MSVDDRRELINARKKLEEQLEELEAAEKKIKYNEDIFSETYRNIRIIEEQREKYSHDKEMVNLLDDAYLSMRDSERLLEEIATEIKESKQKSRNRLEDINEELSRK
ncbi:hypothetical protein [Mogibacterium pumilum]|uniref:Uncharacterized protein n=1 Tax=Mogibacterium pumilum TaxID=86332 RepID=A0A223ATW2_9FIRM|nr:hypothetical protein [Mogibacterium pumilum]ASS38406.1 hypothetical protein AXF17_08385 [Mogibacterium pumilum]